MRAGLAAVVVVLHPPPRARLRSIPTVKTANAAAAAAPT
jgi:hypothetical protein